MLCTISTGSWYGPGAGHHYYHAAIGNPQNHIALNYSIQPMTKQVQPYQQLDRVISARQLPNIAVVNEITCNFFFGLTLSLNQYAVRLTHFARSDYKCAIP